MSIISRIFGSKKPAPARPKSAQPSEAKTGAGPVVAARSKDAKTFGKSGQNAAAAGKKG